jgi:hypothetical protein
MRQYDYPPKVSSSGAPSPRSTIGSGAASPVPTPGGGNTDPDTPKSRLLHSVMGALEAYASSASDAPPHHQQPYHVHSSSASSSPARARSGASCPHYS